MNPYSFQEDEEPSQLHSLQQEIGSEYIDTWIGKSQERIENDYEFESNVLSHFDMNIPSLGDIPENANKNNQGCQEACEVLNEAEGGSSTSSQQRVEEGASVQATQTSSQGQTFFEQAGGSTTVVQSSVVQQQWKKESGKVLNEFILISESIYTPLLSTFKKILSDAKSYSDKTMQNLNMYYLFFSIKLRQEKQRSQILQKKKEVLESRLRQSLLLDSVYLDERVVIQQMVDQDERRRQLVEIFCEKIDESCSKVKMLLSKALEFRTKKIDHIVSYIQRTERIQKELIDLMVKPPLEREPNGWMGKPDMHCDRYLQRKYLQERERLFLSQLKATGEKIIALLHSIFIKEEPVICALLGKEMERYYKLNQQLYGMLRKYEVSTKVEPKKVQEELKEVLLSIVPGQWKISQPKDKNNSVEDIINQLYAYLQDQIFLPTVTIEPELILFQSKGKWITKGELSPKKSPSMKKIKTKGKQNQGKSQIQSANQPTCAALVSDREMKDAFDRVKGMEVAVILTADKYLHLECGERIACLKLKRLKMNRKSDRKIILNERRGSISTLFAASPYLGELILENEQAADAFIGAVLSTQA